MAKMLLFDLDDTLLNSDKVITDRVKTALRSAHESGIRIGYVTARTKWSADKVLKDVPLDAVAYCSGASVYCDGESVYENSVPAETGKRILDSFNTLYPDRKAFSVFGPYSHISGGELWKDGSPCTDNESDIRGRYGYRRIVLIDTSREDIRSFADNELKYIKSRYGGLSITEPDVDKGNAAKVIASYFGYEMDDVAAFGDDRSDFSMLRTCGTGIAMKNAVYEVKSVADYITDTNDRNGVADWLEKHVLNIISAV